jgi:hypothetical protein
LIEEQWRLGHILDGRLMVACFDVLQQQPTESRELHNWFMSGTFAKLHRVVP